MQFSDPQQSTGAAPVEKRLTVDELHALLYREIGISAVAAALRINNEARESQKRARVTHPLPGVLRGHDLAA